MAESRFEDMLRQLLKRTEQRKVQWETTADDGTFIAYFGAYSISLETQTSYDGEDGYTVRLLAEDGSVIDDNNFWQSMNEGSFYLAESLYGAARRVALNIDVAIDQIMKVLGEDEPNEPNVPDDDIPF